VRAKAVLVEAARVLPDTTTTLRSVTRHTYSTPERARHCPALSARSSYRWRILNRNCYQRFRSGRLEADWPPWPPRDRALP